MEFSLEEIYSHLDKINENKNCFRPIFTELHKEVGRVQNAFSFSDVAFEVSDEYVSTADILFCTIGTACLPTVKQFFKHVDLIYLDEGGQTLETDLLPLFALGAIHFSVTGEFYVKCFEVCFGHQTHLQVILNSCRPPSSRPSLEMKAGAS